MDMGIFSRNRTVERDRGKKIVVKRKCVTLVYFQIKMNEVEERRMKFSRKMIGLCIC